MSLRGPTFIPIGRKNKAKWVKEGINRGLLKKKRRRAEKGRAFPFFSGVGKAEAKHNFEEIIGDWGP